MQTVNLLTYNFLQKPISISSVPDEYKSERIELFAKEFASFDVIVLQELFEFWNPRVTRFFDLAKAAGFTHFAKNPVCDFTSDFLLSGGLCIISRYKINNSKFLPFTHCIHGDKFINKGVLWAEIEMPSNNKIHVFSTHCLAYFSYLDFETKIIGHIERVKEFLIIKKLIKEILRNHHQPNDLTILCGDFNVNGLNDEFPFDDVVQLLNVSEKEKYYLKTKNEFDFYRKILEFKNEDFKIKEVFFSDHDFRPVTNGLSKPGPDGIHVPVETLITDTLDRFDNSSLDYILEIIPLKKEETKNKTEKARILQKTSKLEQFRVTHKILTQLSDHFGISVKLNA